MNRSTNYEVRRVQLRRRAPRASLGTPSRRKDQNRDESEPGELGETFLGRQAKAVPDHGHEIGGAVLEERGYEGRFHGPPVPRARQGPAFDVRDGSNTRKTSATLCASLLVPDEAQLPRFASPQK